MSTSRIILFFTVVLVACALLVSAAPMEANNGAVQLEVASVNGRSDRRFRKHHNKDGSYRRTRKHRKYSSSSSSTRSKKTSTSTTTYAKATSTSTTTTYSTTKSSTTSSSPSPTPKKNASSSSSSSYTGDGTFYDAGLGSCGIESTNSDHIVAINHGQMGNGANPNHNPLCGKKIRVKGPKGSTTATIVDTCPGCAWGDVDLSYAAFEDIADFDAGRVKVTWSFI
ncbi:RlpA-like double-psi beta-barrel-protein domain-containing protein-containing protein [Pilaira anomala]|nr:RlpA-like double-psi beta-barrel-protein domain-containing protein-containing protein [Pilaira anomala]